jgi:predicted Zn-dependent protease
MKKNLLIPAVIAGFLLAGSCATNPVSKKKQIVFMSEEQEIAMGKEADPQIIAQYGLYEDKALQDFFNQKGQEMAKISHRPKLDFHFRVVDSDILNAFAVPGGYVYFTRGILAHFNNEAQMAGVLGHEIGHVTARHTVEQQRNAILGQGGILLGVILAPDLAGLAEPAAQGVGLMLLKFGRDAERESDRLGVEYSTKIGYDAKEMADFFKTLERQGARSGQGELPEFLSTHPNPGDRYNTVHKLAKEWKEKQKLSDLKVNRNSYLKMIEGIVYGEDPRQGYFEQGMFYHPSMKFQFVVPQGWQYQNTPSQVQMASKDGKAMLMLTAGKGSSLEEAANAFHQQNGLQPIDAKETTVNGLPALAVLADSKPQQGQQQQQVIRTQSYFIKYADAIFLLLGAASAPDFASYQTLFSGSQESFKELTDASKINKKPERIRLKSARGGSTLQEVLLQNNVPEQRLEEHAILAWSLRTSLKQAR